MKIDIDKLLIVIIVAVIGICLIMTKPIMCVENKITKQSVCGIIVIPYDTVLEIKLREEAYK